MQDLCESLIHYFLAAAIAGRFTARGFIRGVMQILDPKLFRLPGLQLRLDKNTIELPGAFSVFGIELRINGELECSGISDAPGEVVSKAHGSKLMCDQIAENDPQPPPLRGKDLDDALDRWALALCGGDLTKLPADWTLDRYGVDRTKDLSGADLTKLKNREELLPLARKEPGFSRVNQQDIRALRHRLAPKEITSGGRRMHARRPHRS